MLAFKMLITVAYVIFSFCHTFSMALILNVKECSLCNNFCFCPTFSNSLQQSRKNFKDLLFECYFYVKNSIMLVQNLDTEVVKLRKKNFILC